jgi:diguanylate cyclase (GGDEF)-like protein/PAS domain S-box-containing protein
MCPRMSLATKTTVLIAATFFTVLVGTSLFLLHYQAESLKGSILQGLDGQAKIAAHGIEAFLDEGLTESNAASATFPEEALVAGRVGEVESHLRKMSATFPKFQNGIFVLDREGRLLVDYPPHPELRGQSFAFREYYQRTIQEGKGIVGKPYRSKRTGAPVLTFTAPVRDGKGQIIAIVACSMDLRSHEALGGYRKQKIGETGYLYVFDKSRLLVLHPDDEREMTYVEVGKNRVLEAALQGFEGAGESVNSAGVPMLLAVRRIPHSEWMVGVQITQKESYEPIGVARTRIFSLSSTAIVLAAILGGVAIRRVSRPLQQLERVASQISTDLEAAETQGTYNPSSSTLDSLRRICSGDEVGLLASAFSHLATRLNLTLDSMRRSAEALRLQATALESTANAIVITDRQGSIQWVNPAFTVLTGYTAEEALGQEPSFLKSGAHDAHFYQTLWNTILSGAVWRGEITNRRKDGTPYVEEMTITPVRSDKGEITQFIAIKVDITERKQADKALRESEERYRSLFENMLHGFAYCKMLFDDHGRPADFIYLAVNSAFETLTGLENIVGKKVTEAIPQIKESLPELLEIYGRVALTGQPEKFEIELKPLGIWCSISAYGTQRECFVSVMDNITERKRAEEALRETEERYRLIFEENSMGISQSSVDGRYLSVNPAFARMLGYDSPEEMIASVRPGQLYVDDDCRCELARQLREQGEFENCEFQLYRKDGSKLWVRGTARVVRSADGSILYHVGAAEDITARKTAEEQIEFLAYYDALTGLPNRTLFRDRLGKALASARRRGEKVALLFLDLDRFKTINDSLGHSVGDLLLKEVAERLKKWAREQDTVARLGGDEFVVVLTALMDIGDAAVAADRILKAMTPDCIVQGHLLSISCSLGISVFPDNGREPETLLKNADAAMYCAKEQGRNNFQFFTQEMNVQAVERMTLENSLRVALERNELFLVYQPQMDIATGQITGAEALLRWQHPVLGLVPPDKFIPIAENSGLIIPIGEWVLKTACVQARQWQDEGLPAIPVAVNVSAIQLRHNRFLQVVEKVLDEAGLRSQYLELELTEGLLFSNADLTLSLLQELSEMGLKLSIDDFGTGYSSLSYLRHFPVCKLKIDRSFVQAMTVNSDDAAITSTIINMGKSLNLTVIAEGVENEEQMSFLRDHGCDEIQGYYFSRPLAVADFPAKVRGTLSALVGQDLDPFQEDFQG